MSHGSGIGRARVLTWILALVPVLLTVLLMAMLALMLAACATDAGRSAFRHTETELEAAREQAAIECATPGDCALAWERARAFVQLPGWMYRDCSAQLREAQLEFAREVGGVR
ncbi:hypothetical protein [Paraburkholderia sp. J63]|uniref:hypothetical protein n=1 Tax=Paraburkholderia sp. J63 TaxID=2805434 RepID=UPI002ABE48CE|nr:hypothetical protein [Paraburkholderia sp. J63]